MPSGRSPRRATLLDYQSKDGFGWGATVRKGGWFGIPTNEAARRHFLCIQDGLLLVICRYQEETAFSVHAKIPVAQSQ